MPGRHFRVILVGFVCYCMLIVPLPRAHAEIQKSPTRVIFMHHSVGAGLIAQGGVRESLTVLGYEFWDHGYNDEGLVNGQGDWLGINWDVPGDNTDVDGWHAIFAQPVTSPADNTFSHMLAFDVIIFKSCFPNSNIVDEAMLRDYQTYFLAIRDVIDQHPDKLFIAFTTPPLVPNETTLDNAARAGRWSTYLTSDEYLAGHPNLAVFDFFNALADSDGYLRAEYRADEWDSHPNERANATVGPLLVEFVDRTVRAFTPGTAPAIENVEPMSGAEIEDNAAPLAMGDLLADFEVEALPDNWWFYSNEPVTRFDCVLDRAGVGSSQALRMSYDIPGGGNAGCGFDVDSGTAWDGTAGLAFSWRADAPGLALRVALGVFDPDQQVLGIEDATPFEIELTSSGTDWAHVLIAWSDLARVEWVGDTGVNSFNPARVVHVTLDVGRWDRAESGAIWLDNLELVRPEAD